MKRFFRLLTALAVTYTAFWLINSGALAEAKSIHSTPMQSVEQRIKQLHDLLNEQWEYVLRTSPEFASIIGDKRYNDKLSDFSQAAIDSDLRQARIFLQKFEAVDTAGFPAQEQLNRDLMLRNLRQQLEAAKFKEWEMPVTQFGGYILTPRSWSRPFLSQPSRTTKTILLV